MKKQNHRLWVPRLFIRKAEETAVREGRLNENGREVKKGKMKPSLAYAKARERQLALLGTGLALGTKSRRPAARDELHGREQDA